MLPKTTKKSRKRVDGLYSRSCLFFRWPWQFDVTEFKTETSRPTLELTPKIKAQNSGTAAV